MKLNSEKLNIAMATACFDVNELCEKAGVSAATLAQIRSGRRNAKPKTIGRFARALDVPVTELIEKEE